jgi:CBS domain-containing protein
LSRGSPQRGIARNFVAAHSTQRVVAETIAGIFALPVLGFEPRSPREYAGCAERGGDGINLREVIRSMSVHDDERERALEEERPGPPDLESVLFSETLKDAAANPPIVVEPTTSLAQVLKLMREHRRGVVLVEDEKRLRGIFTERDVLLKIAGNKIELERTPVSEFMTADPDALPEDSSIGYALNKMVGEGYRHIPLVDDHARPTGVVSMRDLIEFITGFYSKDVLNLPPDPRLAPRRREGA